jgi:hypothetical protein
MSIGRIPNPDDPFGGGFGLHQSFPGWYGWWRPGWWGWWYPGWWGWRLLQGLEELNERELGKRLVEQADDLVKQAEMLRRMGEGVGPSKR